MKKILFAAMLSASLFSMQAAQAESQIQGYVDNTHVSSETDVGTNNAVVTWFLKGVAYYVLENALDAAWDLIKNAFSDDDKSDLQEGCDFIDAYGGSSPSECDIGMWT